MILFICHGNVARSQFAEALARRAGFQDVMSAGTHVKPEKEGRRLADDGPFALNAVACFKAVTGSDLADMRRTQVTAAMAGKADKIISLVARETLPDFVLACETKVEYWPVTDPHDFDEAGYTAVIEQIQSYVAALKQPGNGNNDGDDRGSGS
jgi:protein-tyrosine-phosphatase